MAYQIFLTASVDQRAWVYDPQWFHIMFVRSWISHFYVVRGSYCVSVGFFWNYMLERTLCGNNPIFTIRIFSETPLEVKAWASLFLIFYRNYFDVQILTGIKNAQNPIELKQIGDFAE
jgi:hypothetical protein